MVEDSEQGCAVLVVAPPCTDAGWRAYIDAIDAMQTRVGPRTRPVLVQVLRPGIGMPNAMLRREMANLRSRIRPDAINAVVAEDASIRLMQTALDWLRKPHYQSSSHPDFASALAHIERTLGERRPALRRLYREAIERAPAP